MMYRRQTHRYIYYDRESMGHIINHDGEVCFCSKKKKALKKLGKLTTVTMFREEQQLCHHCQGVLKKLLAEEYGIEGWA